MTEERTPVDAAITVVVSDDIELGERAHLNYGGILEAKGQVGRDFLVLGRLLKENRDKKYFKALGYDTFEDFLGSPDIAMSRSMVFDLVRAVEVFIDKLARPIEELAAIGISKLSAVAKDDKAGLPVVYQDPEEWMSKAKELSRSDLLEEVAPFTPNPHVRRSDAPRSTDQRPISPGEAYADYVRNSPCCICGKPSDEGGKSNAAHFPVSRGAGAPADWVIPMCGDCHAEHHQDPAKFMVTYQQKWSAWFFRTIGMYDKALRDATGTTKVTLPGTTDTTKSDATHTTKPPKNTTHTTNRVSPPPSALPSPLPESGANEESVGPSSVPSSHEEDEKREGEGSATALGAAVVASVSDVADARLTPSPSPSDGLKQIWPPAGGFERCYACHLVLPVSDLEGGLCGSCRPSPLAPASSDGLAFPKPVAAKRRGKKGGRK